MEQKENILENINFYDPSLKSEIVNNSLYRELPGDTEILRVGQYIKAIPLVLKGLIKVFTRYEDKELLLYYIQPQESCIMTFAAGMKNEPSKVFAVTEEDSIVLLLPLIEVEKWIKQYPEINKMFFHQYNIRYNDLIETIHQVLFDNMDKRLYEYFLQKAKLTGKNPMRLTHRQIAEELGTAREVVSRLVKKLEHENKVKQLPNSIQIFGL